MLHDISAEGLAFRLRPVQDADAELIVRLRNDAGLNRFIHQGAATIAQQRAWLAAYYERAGDYYFVVERLADGMAEGLVSIYDVDDKRRAAEWGRWILKPGSLAAVESAWLTYQVAFEKLDLLEVYCRTVTDNEQVVAFHDSCGIAARTVLPDHFDLGARRVDAVQHRVDVASWQELSARLRRIAELTARRIGRG